jgi:hypothetical protein
MGAAVVYTYSALPQVFINDDILPWTGGLVPLVIKSIASQRGVIPLIAVLEKG